MTDISFVIPALNEELLIGRCIRSIKREIIATNIDAEIVVVDNGSTDSTPIIAELNRPRDGTKFDVVRESRRGILWAKQAGLKATSAPLVAFIDADCMLRTGWIKTAIKNFYDGDVVAVSGPYHYYDLPFGRYLADAMFAGMAILAKFLPSMMGGNSIFVRSALEESGFNTSITFWGEDTSTAKRMAQFGKVIFDPKLKVDSSGRRLMMQGYVNTSWTYMSNFIAIHLTGEPATKAHQKDFR